MIKKINSMIVQADVIEFPNERTGEIITMTKILYTIDREDTTSHVGPALLECYKVGNCLNKMKPYVLQKAVLEIEERPTKNGAKYVISKINNVEI